MLSQFGNDGAPGHDPADDRNREKKKTDKV